MHDERESEAWVDERRLGDYLQRRYGGHAGLLAVYVLRDLLKGKHARRYRCERYRADGARIGPELKVPLETALLMLDIFEAAHLASLRVIATRHAALAQRSSGQRLEDALEMLLAAGCEPPPQHS